MILVSESKKPRWLARDGSLVIQAMGFSLIVPLAIISGILILRRSVWGNLQKRYLL